MIEKMIEKLLHAALMIAGVTLVFVGALMMFIYVQEVFSVLDAADKSLIYRHLLVFIIGLGAAIGGGKLFSYSFKSIRSK